MLMRREAALWHDCACSLSEPLQYFVADHGVGEGAGAQRQTGFQEGVQRHCAAGGAKGGSPGHGMLRSACSHKQHPDRVHLQAGPGPP